MLLRVECNFGSRYHLHFNMALNVKGCLLWEFELQKHYEEKGYMFGGWDQVQGYQNP